MNLDYICIDIWVYFRKHYVLDLQFVNASDVVQKWNCSCVDEKSNGEGLN